MSSQSQIFLYDCAQILAVTILFYDHALTFPTELRVIWRRPLGKGAWLFLLNRYIAFFGNLPNIVLEHFVILDEAGCRHYLLLRECVLLSSVLVIGFIMASRTYALYNRSKKLLALLAAWSIITFTPACVSLFVFSKSEAPSPTLTGCHVATITSTAIYTAVAWECLLAFDTMIVVLTLIRGRFFIRGHTRSGSRRSDNWPHALRRPEDLDLGTLVTRDGGLYFIIVTLANLANIVTWYAAPPLLRGVLSSPASVISTTLCSRLVLNVHKAAGAGVLPSTSAPDSSTLDTAAAFTSRFALDDEALYDATPMSRVSQLDRDRKDGSTQNGRRQWDVEEIELRTWESTPT